MRGKSYVKESLKAIAVFEGAARSAGLFGKTADTLIIDDVKATRLLPGSVRWGAYVDDAKGNMIDPVTGDYVGLIDYESATVYWKKGVAK